MKNYRHWSPVFKKSHHQTKEVVVLDSFTRKQNISPMKGGDVPGQKSKVLKPNLKEATA